VHEGGEGQTAEMIKYILLVLIVAAVGFGGWFWTKTDPQKLDFVDRVAPGMAEHKAAPTTGVAYGDDDRQKLDIYVPEGKANVPYPVLVFFHGGAWRDGERDGYGFLGRAFAARGIVTVVADYRKAPKHRFPAFVEDTASAIAWVNANIGNHGGNPEEIYIMGHSAGGHLVTMVALDPQWLAAKGLKTSVIKGVVGMAGGYDFLPLTTDSSKIALGGWPRLEETQPITYARADAPRMLLMTGDNDTVVKPRNSKSLNARMNELGGKSELKIYPGVDHADIVMAIARPFRGKAPVIADVTRFIKGN
jgi:acetyl esterase/lipase